MSDVSYAMHIPVLFNETISRLDPHSGQFAIDGTIGGGGHARELFKRVLPDGILLGVDWDSSQLAATRTRILDEVEGLSGSSTRDHGSHLILAHGNYADLPLVLKQHNLPLADMLLLDLGFSSYHVEEANRGFSFRRDEPLLMTYDDSLAPVKNLVRELREEELADVIYQYSGERFSRRIAKAIKERLKEGPIETTEQLRDTIASVLPKAYERGRIDPATRTFQALRIVANKELENLERVLAELPQIVKPGGKIAIISFHSLEDKIVKDRFRQMAKAGTLEILTKKPIAASREEIKENPRSRSAKLRVAHIT